MIWNAQNFERADAALRSTLSVKKAAAKLGINPGTLSEAYRKHGRRAGAVVLAGKRDLAKSLARQAYDAAQEEERATTKALRSTSKRKVAGGRPKEEGPLLKALRRPARPEEQAKTYVVVSDVHVPYQSEEACGAVEDLLRDLQPDGLVINGDYLDLLEVSRHSQQSVAQLEGLRISKSFDAGNEQLDRWFAAGGPNMKDNHFVDGNHCDRLRRWISSGDNAVWLGDESVSIGKRLRFAERGMVYHEGYPKAHVKLGHLLVTHGRFTSKYAASTHLDRYGHSVLVGHCHTPGMHFGSALGKQKAGFVQGHLANPNSPAMSYAPEPSSWCQGFSVVVVEPNGNFHVTLVNLVDGAFYYGGKRYGRPMAKKTRS